MHNDETKNNDKRKLTSRLNALKSTGPKTPDGKLRSAANSRSHGAYAQNLILPGEELVDYQTLLDTHFDTWKPTNPIEEIFVVEMATTLWSLRRQHPAESSLIHIQIQRMAPALNVEFGSINSHGLYALAVAALHSQGSGLSQIARQGRRLQRQYKNLCQQLLALRQLFPPVTPEPDGFHPPPDPPAENEPVETKLTDDSDMHPQPALEIGVHNPLSIAYAALPSIVKPAEISPKTTQATSTSTQQHKPEQDQPKPEVVDAT